MENKKGKCILLILFVVSFITLKLLHANDNNLDNFHAGAVLALRARVHAYITLWRAKQG